MEFTVASVYDCVDAFVKLLNIEYEIIVGRKLQKVSLKIEFRKADLHHLLGLQYLIDRPEFNHDREKIFNDLQKKKISCDHIEKSHHYAKIRDRLDFLPFMETIFDDNSTVFKYNKTLNSFSRITAEYLLKSEVFDKNVFIFYQKQIVKSIFADRFFLKTKLITVGGKRYGRFYIKRMVLKPFYMITCSL